MLVNPRFKTDPQYDQILSLIGMGGRDIEIEPGIFMSPSFNMGNKIANAMDEYFFFDIDDLSSYGVCDTIDQVKEKYSQWLNLPDMKFCISFTKVTKSEQGPVGGWRWHKWGPYIGSKTPQHTYLYDEDDSIQEVLIFHIYRLEN